MKPFFYLFILSFSVSTLAQTLKIRTIPEKATISVAPVNKEEYRKINDNSSAKIERSFSSFGLGKVFKLKVEKKGFETANYLITSPDSADVDLLITLKSSIGFEQTQLVDDVITKILEAQRLMRAQQLDDGIKMIEKAEALLPDLSTTKEFLAMAYYLKNDHKRSLASYKKAFMSNPKNTDAYRMMIFLQEKLGVKTPLTDKEGK